MVESWQKRGGQRWSGFSLIEMAIVLTIVSILSVVVYISYSGVQTRAENSKTLSAVTQYIKIIQSYVSQNSLYPTTATTPCLGTAATCARVSGTTTCLGMAGAASNATFMALLRTVSTQTPEPSKQIMNCGGSMYQGAYFGNNSAGGGRSASIVYYLRGNQTCTVYVGSVARTQQDDTTMCVVTMPAL